MLRKISGFLNEQHLIQQNDKIVVGVSGGADSICLLSVLLELKQQYHLSLYVVHIEHGVRGEESRQDAAFVKAVAAKHDLFYREFPYDIVTLSKKLGISVEEAGRKVRYEAFEQVREELRANKIAVAHNFDDNAETMLLNLIRGTGLSGLTGIAPCKGLVIRPLLCVSRREIESYLEERRISYRTDSTNYSTDYTRNKIRLQLLPYIEQNINESVKEHLNQTAAIVKEANDYIEQQGRIAYNECVTRQDSRLTVFCKAFFLYPPVIQKQVIRICIGEFATGLKDITARHIHSVLALSKKQVGKQVELPMQIVVAKGYETMTFSKKEESPNRKREEEIVIIPPVNCTFQGMQFSFSVEPYQELEDIPEKTYTKWFDYDKIKDTLRLRNRKSGDDIEVNASGGKKKIKDYFIDEKIPKERRDGILLLADENHIIWIIGYRISERYKITEDTKLILKVQMHGGKENGR